MGMQANAPWALLLLLPWGACVWWMIRGTVRLEGIRKAAAITVRSVILLLLIAIIAQVQPYWRMEQRNVIFIADRSASVNADAQLGEWIAEAVAAKGEDDRSGIITVGLDAAVERALSGNELSSSDSYLFRAKINEQFTDLSQSLRLASGLVQQAGGGRIVLLSDGAENVGQMLKQASILHNAGIAVDVVPVEPPLRTDAAIESFVVPQTLHQGEKFTFELTIISTSAGSAELRLYADNAELSSSLIQLETGENRFALQSTALEPGFHRFRAELYASGDEREQNNAAYAFSKVSGPPKVLIVEGVEGSSGNIEAAMNASLIEHETIAPERLSTQLASYAAYDSMILNNVPATRIAEKPMEWIAKAVSDYGIGLVMLGGDNSFGLGGYFKTPIEQALPVYMDLKGKRQIPSLGLILVIDRSGSMSDGKLELAKEAAMRTVELLREQDSVGVVAFDSSPWWVVEPTKLADREQVLQQIQGIQAEGGTEIYTALDAAYARLLELQAERKHIILLTDGQSATNPGYTALTDSMNDNQITLSTVAVGDGADQALLSQLAEQAKGRFYFTKDQSTLPAIFSRETVLMSRTYVVEQTFVPAIGQAGGWSAMWSEGLPQLNAYIATTAKETAEVALLAPEGDPVLARWAYGSGRTVAWTSDLTGKWSKDWIQWKSLPDVLAEWIKWTFPQFESVPYAVSAELAGREAKLHIRADSQTSETARLIGIVNDESGEETALQPIPVAPGEYEASLPVSEPGVYLMKVGEQPADGAALESGMSGGTTTGFVIPYSPEYKLSNREGKAALEQLAQATGGRVLSLDNPQEAFRIKPVLQRQMYDWTRYLLIVILLLWLCDIAIRRLSLPYSRAAAWLRKRTTVLRGAASPSGAGAAAQAARVAKLQERKNRSAAFHDNNRVKLERSSNKAVNQAIDDESPEAAAKRRPNLSSSVPSAKPSTESNKSADNTGSKMGESTQGQAADTVNRLLAAKNRKRR